MPLPPTRDPSRLAAEILRYLAGHGDAADTAEGIASWWFTAGAARPPVPAIEAAMELLIRQGHAEKQALPDGRVVYRGARGHRGSR